MLIRMRNSNPEVVEDFYYIKEAGGQSTRTEGYRKYLAVRGGGKVVAVLWFLSYSSGGMLLVLIACDCL